MLAANGAASGLFPTEQEPLVNAVVRFNLTAVAVLSVSALVGTAASAATLDPELGSYPGHSHTLPPIPRSTVISPAYDGLHNVGPAPAPVPSGTYILQAASVDGRGCFVAVYPHPGYVPVGWGDGPLWKEILTEDIAVTVTDGQKIQFIDCTTWIKVA